MYANALPLLILPRSSSMRLTAGLRCAPDAPPNAKTAAAAAAGQSETPGAHWATVQHGRCAHGPAGGKELRASSVTQPTQQVHMQTLKEFMPRQRCSNATTTIPQSLVVSATLCCCLAGLPNPTRVIATCALLHACTHVSCSRWHRHPYVYSHTCTARLVSQLQALTHCHDCQAVGRGGHCSRCGATYQLQQRAACELSCQLRGGGPTAAIAKAEACSAGVLQYVGMQHNSTTKQPLQFLG
jgi:hypothetical protein